jgi:hypothetical protein
MDENTKIIIIYRSTSEAQKKANKKYQQKPETIEKRKAYMKEYYAKKISDPEYKKKRQQQLHANYLERRMKVNKLVVI